MTPDNMTPEEALAHYGVKGMRWGVRRKSGGGSSKAPKTADQERRIAVAKTAGKTAAIAGLSMAGAAAANSLGVPGILGSGTVAIGARVASAFGPVKGASSEALSALKDETNYDPLYRIGMSQSTLDNIRASTAMATPVSEVAKRR